MARLLSYACIFLLAITANFSCIKSKIYPESQEWTREDFSVTKDLKGKVMEFDSMIMKPFKLNLYDSILLVHDLGADRHIVVYNLNTKKEIGERIDKGQGPNEMINPFFVDSRDSVKIFDGASSTLFVYSLQDFVENEKPVASQKVTFSERPLFSELAQVGEQYVAIPFYTGVSTSLFGVDGNKIKNLGNFPDITTEKYSEMEYSDAFMAQHVGNGKDRIVRACNFTDLLDIYDTEGNLVKELFGPDRFYTRFEEFNEDGIMGCKPAGDVHRRAFYSPYGTDKHFYVLYNGMDVSERPQTLNSNDIFVFDWNGTPEVHYILDKGVGDIVVDEQNRKIYGISDDPEYHFVEFDF